MFRPFLLSLVVVGAGASSVSEPAQPTDVATWRYQVSAILDSQRAGDNSTRLGALMDYDQRYQRYEGAGQPVPAAPAAGR